MDKYGVITPELTSTIFALTSAVNATTRALTALSQHPYDYAKNLYFEEGHIFPTIDEIQVPEHITPEILIKKFETRHQEYESVVLNYLASPEQYDLSHSNNQLNLLSVLSSDNKFVIPKNKYSTYITALEVLQSINMDNITDENCEELVVKIGYTVLNALS